MAAGLGLAATIELSNLGSITLRPGDNDRNQVWGGESLAPISGTPIFDLQSALTAAGIALKTDGSFGPETKTALSRYQWYRAKLNFGLKLTPGAAPMTGLITPSPPFVSRTLGVCDQTVASDLLAFRAGGFITTTPLVRFSIQGFANLQKSDQFTALDYPLAEADEILVHTNFVDVVGVLNEQALATQVVLRLNQAFRRADVAPSGAVVRPAKKSQHLVGYAVDLNIIDGDTINTANVFKTGKETAAANAFIKGVKAKGIRWGGDFSETDPVHFDDFLNPNGEDYDMTYFFAQQCFQAQHPMRRIS